MCLATTATPHQRLQLHCAAAGNEKPTPLCCVAMCRPLAELGKLQMLANKPCTNCCSLPHPVEKPHVRCWQAPYSPLSTLMPACLLQLCWPEHGLNVTAA